MKRILLCLSVLICTFTNAQETVYKTIENLTYATSQDAYAQERCKLDIYYPENLKDCPTVIWFHGGGLTSGNKSIPTKLKKSGMIVIAVNYRLLPKVTISECLGDAAAAIAWTFKEVEKYGGNKKKIFVSGHSAGGYLTAMIVRKDAPPLILITGDRELELFGRYEENAYMWRMMKLVGHEDTYLYEIGGHGHGPMGEPAFYILHQQIKRILNTPAKQ